MGCGPVYYTCTCREVKSNDNIAMLHVCVQAPEEDYFSVHIRVFGDWTEELVRQMGVGRKDFTQAWQLPK